MLRLGHCRQILANKKQERIATVSMKKNLFYFVCSSLTQSIGSSRSLISFLASSFSQSLVLGLQALAQSDYGSTVKPSMLNWDLKPFHQYKISAKLLNMFVNILGLYFCI